MDQEPEAQNGAVNWLERKLAALNALYRKFGRDGFREQPLADVNLLLFSKELQFRDAPKHNLTAEQQAANRQLELEIMDIRAYVKGQTAGLTLDHLRALAPSGQERHQEHYRQKGRGNGR